MKSILFLISIFLVMGVSAAHAQKRTRDVLFPDYANDQLKLKSVNQLQVKSPEAQIKSPQALMDMIFKPGTYKEGSSVRPAAQTALSKEAQQLNSSKNVADAVKEMKEQQAAAQAKIVMPKLEQGTEPQPKSKN